MLLLLVLLVVSQPGIDEDEHPLSYNIGSTRRFQQLQHQGLVTVTFANNAYFEQGLIQNLLCSWKRISFTNYVIVAVDADAYASSAKHTEQYHWHPPWWEGVGGKLLRPTNIKTPEYVRFIHKRTRFIEALLLKTGLDVLLCDGDTIWTRNLLLDQTLPYKNPAYSSCDAFVVNSAHRGGAGADKVEPLGGFILARNRPQTLMWYRTWTAMEACLQSKEQPAMHASLRVLGAVFVKPLYHLLGEKFIDSRNPVLCVLHDSYFPTGFHVTNGYLKDYANTSLIALGHASIPKKTGKEEWMKQYGWWFLEPDGSCSNIKTPDLSQEEKHHLPSMRKVSQTFKYRNIQHWMQEGPDKRNCTSLITSRLPVLREQLMEVTSGVMLTPHGIPTTLLMLPLITGGTITLLLLFRFFRLHRLLL